MAANKLRLAAEQLVRLCRSYYHLLEVVVEFWAQHCFFISLTIFYARYFNTSVHCRVYSHLLEQARK